MMLVLTRRPSEATHITAGDLTIVVTVMEVKGDKVRLGFEADKSVVIHRSEVQREIDAGEGR